VTELPRWLKHATVWLLIAAGLFLAVQAWQKRQDAPRFVTGQGTIELRRGADGHYHWAGTVAGRRVDFLVDTGATGTAIPTALARELGLPVVGKLRSDTAGGSVAAEVVLGDVLLEGGVRAERLRIAALPSLRGPLLGMDVLGRLRWEQRDGRLRVHLGGGAAP
jgi:aspartyl protease family protein